MFFTYHCRCQEETCLSPYFNTAVTLSPLRIFLVQRSNFDIYSWSCKSAVLVIDSFFLLRILSFIEVFMFCFWHNKSSVRNTIMVCYNLLKLCWRWHVINKIKNIRIRFYLYIFHIQFFYVLFIWRLDLLIYFFLICYIWLV